MSFSKWWCGGRDRASRALSFVSLTPLAERLTRRGHFSLTDT